jgi:hypothetical protein
MPVELASTIKPNYGLLLSTSTPGFASQTLPLPLQMLGIMLFLLVPPFGIFLIVHGSSTINTRSPMTVVPQLVFLCLSLDLERVEEEGILEDR